MRFNILLILALLFAGIKGKSQTIEWEHSYGGSNYEFGYTVNETDDGGYFAVGNSWSSDGDVTVNRGYYDYWVVKTDATGTITWQKSYGGSDWDTANDFKQTSDGGYIIVGGSSSTDGDVTGNHGGYDFWLVKVNSTGTLEWQKSYGGSQSDFARSVDITPDGGYVVVGETYSNDGNVSGNHGGYDIWVIKTDANGNLLWQKALGGSDYEYGYEVYALDNGDIIVSGTSASNDGDVTGNHGSGDFWIIKLDSNGNIIWQKSYGGTDYEHARTICPTDDGGYIIAGESRSSDGQVSGNNGSEDVWVVKIDANGNFIWGQNYGGSGVDFPHSIKQTGDGGYVFVAHTYSNDGDVTGNHGDSDYWLVKLNESGQIQWQKCLGGSDGDAGQSLNITSSGAYIINGYSGSSDGDVTGNHGGLDFWIVKIAPPLTITYFTGDTSVCEGDNVTLRVDATGTGTITYSWSFGGNVISTSNTVTLSNVSQSDEGTYTCVVSDDNSSQTVSLYLTVNPLPQPVLNDTGYCQGSSVTLTPGNGFASYQWNTGATTFSITVSSEGTYSVTVTDNNGCSNSASATVTEYPLPQITLNDTAFCSGDTIMLSVPQNFSSYTWNNGNTTYYTQVTTGGNYSVTVTDANGCSATDDATVTENPAPEIALNDTGFCQGSSVTLEVQNGYASYIWNTGETTNSITVQQQGGYSVTVTNSYGCTAIAQATVTEFPLPQSGLPDTAGFCQNTSYTIQANTGYSSYLWNTGATTDNISVTQSGTYYVTITDNNNCQTEDSIVIIEFPAPLVSLPDTTGFCHGDSATLSVSQGYFSYQWNTGATDYYIVTADTGLYSVTVTSGEGCVATDSTYLTEYPAITTTITADTASCGSPATIDLSVYGGTPPFSFVWNTADTTEDLHNIYGGMYYVTITDNAGCQAVDSAFVTDLSDTITIAVTEQHDATCYGKNDGYAAITISGGTPPYNILWSNGIQDTTADSLYAGVYTVTVTDTNGCTGELQISISQPDELIAQINSTDVTCRGFGNGEATVAVTGGTPPYEYLWSNGETYPHISGLIPGTYYVTVTDANNCQTISETQINEPPQLYANYETSAQLCYGDSITVSLTVEGGVPPYSFVWNTGKTDSILTVAPGEYSVTVTDNNDCHVILDVDAGNEIAPITIEDTVISVNGYDFIIDLTVYGGTTPYSFEWNTGHTTEDITASMSGTYTVTVTDINGCQAYDTVVINIGLKIPTVFTPNGDGRNDTWNIYGISTYDDVTIEIFNRWGDMLFSFHGNGYDYAHKENQWDGTYNGKLVPFGEYLYILKLNDKTYKGTVMVKY